MIEQLRVFTSESLVRRLQLTDAERQRVPVRGYWLRQQVLRQVATLARLDRVPPT